MRNYYRGDIYYTNMGEHNGSVQGGVRPVLVIQNDIGNRFSTTVIVATLSTQIHKAKMPTHVILDSKYLGLKKSSFVMLEQIRTVNKEELGTFLGQVSPKDIEKINKATEVSLGLSSVRNKIEEIILKKVNTIKELDLLYVRMLNRNRSQKILVEILDDREEQIKELKDICDINGLNYKNYYSLDFVNKAS